MALVASMEDTITTARKKTGREVVLVMTEVMAPAGATVYLALVKERPPVNLVKVLVNCTLVAAVAALDIARATKEATAALAAAATVLIGLQMPSLAEQTPAVAEAVVASLTAVQAYVLALPVALASSLFAMRGGKV